MGAWSGGPGLWPAWQSSSAASVWQGRTPDVRACTIRTQGAGGTVLATSPSCSRAGSAAWTLSHTGVLPAPPSEQLVAQWRSGYAHALETQRSVDRNRPGLWLEVPQMGAWVRGSQGSQVPQALPSLGGVPLGPTFRCRRQLQCTIACHTGHSGLHALRHHLCPGAGPTTLGLSTSKQVDGPLLAPQRGTLTSNGMGRCGLVVRTPAS